MEIGYAAYPANTQVRSHLSAHTLTSIAKTFLYLLYVFRKKDHSSSCNSLGVA